MKGFLRSVFLFSIPFVIISLTFLIYDPFKILRDYGNELFVPNGTIDGFTLNRDIVSTELLMHNKDVYNYDSFIFGSSRASGFLGKDWESHISSKNPSFHFIGSGESLFGIWKKIRFLDDNDYALSNALLVLDHDLISKISNGDGVISIRHPETSKEYLHFYKTHFLEYISTDFFVQFLDYNFFGKRRGYMDKLFDNMDRGLLFDNIRNDWIHEKKIDAIRADSLGYYDRQDVFYLRDGEKKSEPVITNPKQIKMLKDIKGIFDKQQTKYQIVISPLYDQRTLQEKDVIMLEEIFDRQYVHDFSGVNAITNEVGNYYESSHYKPYVGKSMLEIIYNGVNQ